MSLIISRIAHNTKVAGQLLSLCKFSAFTYVNGVLSINNNCRMCMRCVNEGPPGAITVQETQDITKPRVIDKDKWKGIAVVAEIKKNRISEATFELLGKARELSLVTRHSVQAVVVGSEVQKYAEILIAYADEVYVYDYPELKEFLPEPYAAALESFVIAYMPSSILISASNNGRSLAPKVAARFRTGLTADCTKLSINEDTDLVQIRPAFGGNIMAQILTSNTRPQICTVRAGVFTSALPSEIQKGRIIKGYIDRNKLKSGCVILKTEKKPDYLDISEAEIIVAAGRGVQNASGLALVEELAALLSAQTACTRPLAENGWFNPRRQIGLSGRTVKPKLIITCGISGSVQFAAGMSGSDRIIAINSDPNARIFNIAHYSVVGDIFEILPRMIRLLKGEEDEQSIS